MTKITVCGAAGGIGQPLCLLLKQSVNVSHLALYDVANSVHGVAVDLSHIDTTSEVTSHEGPDQLGEALSETDIVVICAGVPRKPGMSRDDLFKINASIVRDIAVGIAKYAPKAFFCIITNPINSTVPVVSEVLKKYNVYDPRRVFGVTTLDTIRATKFVSDTMRVKPCTIQFPIIGGHSGHTIIPLFSQFDGYQNMSTEQIEELTKRIQFAGDAVIEAKNGNGSATLAMANAGARFTLSVLKGAFMGIIQRECAYINLEVDEKNSHMIRSLTDKVEYFALPVEISKNGIERIATFEKTISDDEKEHITSIAEELKASIAKGKTFITQDHNFKQ